MISYSLDPKGDYIPLDGATLHTFSYIRLEDTGTIRQARFYLDDTLVQIERRAPYYFKGVSITRKPRMASFVDGLHTIRVDYDHRDGQTYSESASFQVGEQPAPRTGNTFPASLNLTIGDQSITMNLTLSVDADGNVTSLG